MFAMSTADAGGYAHASYAIANILVLLDDAVNVSIVSNRIQNTLAYCGVLSSAQSSCRMASYKPTPTETARFNDLTCVSSIGILTMAPVLSAAAWACNKFQCMHLSPCDDVDSFMCHMVTVSSYALCPMMTSLQTVVNSGLCARSYNAWRAQARGYLLG